MTFDFIAKKFAQPVPEVRIDFSCRKCGGATLCSPADGSQGVCPNCCEDHDYQYEPRMGHRCQHCDAQPPDDWFDVE